MRNLRYLFLLAIAGTLAACASIEPVVRHTASPEPSFGYIAGSFTRSGAGAFAFIIRNVESGAEYGMPIGEDSLMINDFSSLIIAIKIPPGRYEVLHWITYGTITKERLSKSEIKNAYLARPFTVEAGSVVHLGSFSVATTLPLGHIEWTIASNPMTSREAKAGFLAAYPTFENHLFSCRLCSDGLAQ